MKSLMKLQWFLLKDMGKMCRVSTLRDWKTISDRVKTEGLSFLTITLPTFSKDFEKSLEEGRISDRAFLAFKTQKGQRLPAFLQGFVSLVFDPWTGVLLDDPDPNAIFCIRQLTLGYKKYRADCTPKRRQAAMDQFVFTDLEVETTDAQLPEHKLSAAKHCFQRLFERVLRPLELALVSSPLVVVPRHGPGATAERILSNRKYDALGWTDRLGNLFPASEFLALPSRGPFRSADGRFCSRTYDRRIISRSPRNELPVRVISVPKTLKTPRVIGIEPICMQFVQQGLLELLAPALEHPIMFGAIGISDQTPNKSLARQSSIDKSLATLDLSEASDRVSSSLVFELLAPYPVFRSMVFAARSTHADVPGYGVKHLAKFASMGSALCFPIEAMVFLTIISLGKALHEGTNDFGDRKVFLKSVRVYGDDIIVPVDMAQSVISELEAFGLKVNRNKSFLFGNFRESCGGDYYNGVDVKPIYIKTDIPRSQHCTEEMVSTVSLRNLLYRAGLWEATSYLDREIERIAPFPLVGDNSPVLGRHTFLKDNIRGERICADLHRPIVKGMILKQKAGVSPLDGEGALLKFFLKRGLDPIFSKDHLQRSGRPESADIRLRWASVQ